MDPDLGKTQKRLGKAIRAKRLEQGYTQEKLARKCGVHRNCIGSVERGERDLPLFTLFRIAKVLGTSPSELFADPED